MKKHTKIYMDYFGYGEQDFIPCELCGSKAVDIHHIRGRKNNDIDNLMALCRRCHANVHDKQLYDKNYLWAKHWIKIKDRSQN